jgi:hypothetical protein
MYDVLVELRKAQATDSHESDVSAGRHYCFVCGCWRELVQAGLCGTCLEGWHRRAASQVSTSEW